MSLNCFDDASGSATVSSIGGFGPYHLQLEYFKWSFF